jgi:hypothetical protein
MTSRLAVGLTDATDSAHIVAGVSPLQVRMNVSLMEPKLLRSHQGLPLPHNTLGGASTDHCQLNRSKPGHIWWDTVVNESWTEHGNKFIAQFVTCLLREVIRFLMWHPRMHEIIGTFNGCIESRLERFEWNACQFDRSYQVP